MEIKFQQYEICTGTSCASISALASFSCLPHPRHNRRKQSQRSAHIERGERERGDLGDGGRRRWNNVVRGVSECEEVTIEDQGWPWEIGAPRVFHLRWRRCFAGVLFRDQEGHLPSSLSLRRYGPSLALRRRQISAGSLEKVLSLSLSLSLCVCSGMWCWLFLFLHLKD